MQSELNQPIINGKPIQVGDIVEWEVEHDEYPTLHRDSVAYDGEWYLENYGDLLSGVINKCEKIGNVKDNPELLKMFV